MATNKEHDSMPQHHHNNQKGHQSAYQNHQLLY